jgi:hypothetical protein
MEADGPPLAAAAGHAGGFDPAKKTIAELKAWLTEHGEENQVCCGCSAGLLATRVARTSDMCRKHALPGTLYASKPVTERRCTWQVWDLNARKAKKTDYVAAAQAVLARP